ncbi:hypothetical protein ATPR_0477 [Acetobacter tropicalis NBRC 101654]|uniref:Uncharacterized protein n=1 Tax=Acetobacter tropicalis NBRC 101654 TaxID=749388 RepID=F7VAS8_9PROT|nr:hypothetical protein ATPR_0477 [Acetobacter tropicalis NBRC 101654]
MAELPTHPAQHDVTLPLTKPAHRRADKERIKQGKAHHEETTFFMGQFRLARRTRYRWHISAHRDLAV